MAHIRMLQFKQPYFFGNSSCIPCQASICAYYAVAGNDNRNFIMSDSTANCLCRHFGKSLFSGKPVRNFSIGCGLSVGNLQEDIPYRLSKYRSHRMQWRKKVRFFTSKINIQPVFRFGKNLRFLRLVFLWQIVGKVFFSFEP